MLAIAIRLIIIINGLLFFTICSPFDFKILIYSRIMAYILKNTLSIKIISFSVML